MGLFSTSKLFGITIRESANDGSDFTNPDADYRRLFLGEDGKLHVKDPDGTVTDPFAAAGSVATDAIFDAKGDLPVGTGANTAAKLAAGSNTYVLTADSGEATGLKWAAAAAGGTPSGTAFPGSPTSGDLFYRTNIHGGMLFRYDGTRWVSDQLFSYMWDAENVGTGDIKRYGLPHDYSVWVVRHETVAYVGNPNNGSNYWDFVLKTATSNPGTFTTVATWNTSTFTQETWASLGGDIGVAIDTSTAMALHLAMAVAAGSPGNVYPKVLVYYRLIAT